MPRVAREPRPELRRRAAHTLGGLAARLERPAGFGHEFGDGRVALRRVAVDVDLDNLEHLDQPVEPAAYFAVVNERAVGDVDVFQVGPRFEVRAVSL